MKKKMLYIMHIDWNWIKQRPQFLAEELSQYYDMTIVYTYGYRRNFIKQSNKFNGFKKIIPLYRLPSVKVRNTFFGKIINDLILKIQFLFIGKDFDYIWLTSPIYIEIINKIFKDNKIKIIYDCMDDNIGIKDESSRKKTIDQEIVLLQRADTVFVSSINLQQVIKNRGYKGNCYLLYNGISNNLLNQNIKDNQLEKNIKDNQVNNAEGFNLLYIGTIAYWFDFEKILKLLNEFNNITITLIGPCETEMPYHSRLIYKGIIPHSELPYFAAKYDALIMPFLVNELILSVDPVKIYEYISFGKNIISIYYPEMDKFKDFVHFYRTYDELKTQVMKLISNNKLSYTKDKAEEFLRSNTWKVRAKEVYNILEHINE